MIFTAIEVVDTYQGAIPTMKCVVVGDPGVGKSFMLNMYVSYTQHWASERRQWENKVGTNILSSYLYWLCI